MDNLLLSQLISLDLTDSHRKLGKHRAARPPSYEVQLWKGDFTARLGTALRAWGPHTSFTPDSKNLVVVGPLGKLHTYDVSEVRSAAAGDQGITPGEVLLPSVFPWFMKFGAGGCLYLGGTQISGGEGQSGLALAIDDRLTLRRHGQVVKKMLFNQDGTEVLVAGDDELLSQRFQLGVYSGDFTRALAAPIGSAEDIVATAISQAGQHIATLDRGGLLIIWDVVSPLATEKDLSHALSPNAVVSSDGRYVATKAPLGPWAVYSRDNGELERIQDLTTNPKEEQRDEEPIFVPGGRLIAAAEYTEDKKKVVRVQWRLFKTDRQGADQVLNANGEGCERPTFSKDGRLALAASQRTLELVRLDRKERGPLWVVDPEDPPTCRIIASSVSPRALRVAAVVSTSRWSLTPPKNDTTNEVRIWKCKLPDEEPLAFQLTPTQKNFEVRFTHDDTRLIVIADSSVLVFTLADPRSVPLRLEHREPIRSADLSSDDERLLTDGATIVRVWDMNGGAQLAAATHNQQVKPQSRGSRKAVTDRAKRPVRTNLGYRDRLAHNTLWGILLSKRFNLSNFYRRQKGGFGCRTEQCHMAP